LPKWSREWNAAVSKAGESDRSPASVLGRGSNSADILVRSEVRAALAFREVSGCTYPLCEAGGAGITERLMVERSALD
jgi:hypothetical protein